MKAGAQPIDRRSFLQRVAAAGALTALPPCLSACAGGAPATRNRPNLILIMADDLGYADLSAFGRTDYSTPNLDRLVLEGVKLTQAYSAAPVCTPTRVALMTGAYPARTEAGLYEPLTTHPTGLATTPPTLSRRLKDAGYQTALVGKWHLGTLPRFHPFRHGFDEFYGFLGAAADYASHIDTEHLAHLFQDGETPVRAHGYLTDLFTERAVQIVSRPRDQPLFLSLQYNAPHWPWQAPGDPPYPDSLRWSRGGSRDVYARMVESMDAGIGRLLAAVREQGLQDDTLVIFTSDNGGERFSDMGPFRSRKGDLWEGGIRVAAAARWPGVIPAGSTSDQVVITMDWTATLLAAAGITLDATAARDGIDLTPVLSGSAAPRARELYWRTFQRTRHKALRAGDWKYVVTPDGAYLFDLAADQGEKHDFKADRADTFARLEAAYAAWEVQVLEPIPLDPVYA
jgi:arylsulfatase A-like enzyme